MNQIVGLLVMGSGSIAWGAECPELTGAYVLKSGEVTGVPITLRQVACAKVTVISADLDTAGNVVKSSEVSYQADGVMHKDAQSSHERLEVLYSSRFTKDRLINVSVVHAPHDGVRYITTTSFSLNAESNLVIETVVTDQAGVKISEKSEKAIRQK